MVDRITEIVVVPDLRLEVAEVLRQEDRYITVEDNQITVVEIAQRGPPGFTNENDTLGGYPVTVEMLAVGSLLRFNGTAWVNVEDENLTDGGNF